MAEKETNVMDAEPLKLEGFLPYRLSVLSNTISRSIAAMYEAEFGLSVWQWRVMAVLGEHPGLTARDVTARTAMDKVAVSRAVSGLERMGHLKRKNDVDDGRASRLHLTRSGKRTYDKIMPRAAAYEQDLLASLSARDQAALTRVLNALADAASPNSPLW